MGRIDELANRYVAEWAPLSPIGATYVGIAGHDDQLDDLSPEGYAARADLDRRTLAELDVTEPDTEAERIAKEAMQERLGLDLARYDAGETTSEISVIASGLHEVRMVLRPDADRDGDEAGQHRRPAQRPAGALEGYKTHAARGARRRPGQLAGAADRGRQAVRHLDRPGR